jgi:hypothetical protein
MGSSVQPAAELTKSQTKGGFPMLGGVEGFLHNNGVNTTFSIPVTPPFNSDAYVDFCVPVPTKDASTWGGLRASPLRQPNENFCC